MIATFGGVLVASAGLRTWRAQLRASSRHAVAMDIAQAAGDLHREFFNQRAPLIEPSEYPVDFEFDGRPTGSRAQAIKFALNARYKRVHRRGHRLFVLRGKALAILGVKEARAVEELARFAQTLELVWRRLVRLLEQGEQADVRALRQTEAEAFSPFQEEHSDQLSRDFERSFSNLMVLLRPNIDVE